jgi:hypothetical protein
MDTLKIIKPLVLVHFKKQGFKIKFETTKWFLRVRFPVKPECLKIGNHLKPLEFEGAFTADDRNRALDAEYGADFARLRENPNAGNIRTHDICLGLGAWQRFLAGISIK